MFLLLVVGMKKETKIDKDLQAVNGLVVKVLLNGPKSHDKNIQMQAANQARKLIKGNCIKTGLTPEDIEACLKDFPTFEGTSGCLLKQFYSMNKLMLLV